MDISEKILYLVLTKHLTPPSGRYSCNSHGEFGKFTFTPSIKTVSELDDYYLLHEKEINSYILAESSLAESIRSRYQLQLQGFDYLGVRYSATDKDFQEITNAAIWIQTNNTIELEINFENGARLTLDSVNIAEFMDVWMSFRNSTATLQNDR